MKRLTQYIKSDKSSFISLSEKLLINKDFNKKNGIKITEFPKNSDELKKIIKDRYDKLGPGTKQKPIDFNDIDTSSITDFVNVFNRSKFEYIDISGWDASRVDSMMNMFYSCEKLVFIGDIGEWDVSNVETFRGMFFNCRSLESIGDLSEWKVTDKLRDVCSMFCMCFKLKNIGDIGKWEMRNVSNTCEMFQRCDELEYIGDVSSWDLRSVMSMPGMFYGCKNLTDIGDLTKWHKPNAFRRDHLFGDVFTGSSIKNTPDWVF